MINAELAKQQTNARKRKNTFAEVLDENYAVDGSKCDWQEVLSEDFDPFAKTVKLTELDSGLLHRSGQPDTVIDTALSPSMVVRMVVYYETDLYTDADCIPAADDDVRQDITEDMADVIEGLVLDTRLHLGEKLYHEMLAEADLGLTAKSELLSDLLIEEHIA